MDASVGQNFNQTLFRSVGATVEPGIIQTISKDNATNLVTLKLNKSCGWSDGTPITAADVKAGLETIFSPQASNALPRSGLFENGDKVISGELPASALGIETPDDNTVQFYSEYGTENIKTLFSIEAFIPMPSWILKDNPDFPFSGKKPSVFSGSYQVDFTEPNVIHLKRNPYSCAVAPFFDTVDIVNLEKAEEFVNVAATMEDLVIYSPGTSREVTAELMSIDWLNERYETLYLQRSSIAFMRLNALNGPFQSDDLRKVFNLAIDWEGADGASSRLMSGNGVRAPATISIIIPSRKT